MLDTRAHCKLLALMTIVSPFVGIACTGKDDTLTTGNGGTSQAGASGSGGAGVGGSAGSGGSNNSGGSGGQAGNPGGSGGGAGSTSGGSGGAVNDAGVPDANGGLGDAASATNYVLLDFAGASTGSEIKTVINYDVREKFSFAVSGNHTASATVEVVNSQAQLAFAQTDPDATGADAGNVSNEDVFQFVKIPGATGDGSNWGGYAHVIFDLGSALPESLVGALPQWDNANTTIVAGTKVVQLDVYYDDTVDPDYDWANVSATVPDGAQGYRVDLQLVNYVNHANFAGAQDSGGYYIGYTAYVTQPNTWVTLTFEAADVGRADNFFSSGSALAASASQVTGVGIKPAGGYDAQDSNPVYLRNLRVVDAP